MSFKQCLNIIYLFIHLHTIGIAELKKDKKKSANKNKKVDIKFSAHDTFLFVYVISYKMSFNHLLKVINKTPQ
jgi:hypothetical protein